MLVDKHANMKRRKPVFIRETFYGQLQHIYIIKWPASCSDTRVEPEKPIFLVAIRSCKLLKDDPELSKLDIHLYSEMGKLDIVDITSVQALVGRVKTQVAGGQWAVIDRSGALARAVYDDDVDDDNE